jgi:hypothetical protein
MPLIDLKTDLKSLKYGKDRPGGGDSGQPYQKVDINRVDSGFNRFRMTKFDDGLVRGGVVGAANAAVVDTLRIGKFLKDFPKGPLFIVKQVGLQLSNPVIEHKTNFPTNKPTRGQGLFNNVGNFISNIANKILNAVGPTRIYNLGINTLAQIPVNAFGQHIVRHGFTPRRDDSNLYFKVAQYNNNEGNNRLTQLRSILGNTRNINTYIGGPSSIYGIGSTTIQRRGKFININQDTTASTWATSKEVNDSSYVQSSAKNLISTSNLKIGADLGLSRKTFSKLAGDLKIPINPSGSAAYDRIASKNDPKNITYVAVEQEASASAKMRTPNEFIGASKFVSSSLSTTAFPDLTSIGNKPLTLDGKIASASDPKNILNSAIGQEASASAKMRVPNEFVGASKFISSSLSTSTFSDLTSISNKSLTLDGKIASVSDPKNITYKAIGQEASASAKMRTPDAFVGASTKTSSQFAPSGFSGLTSATNKPQTLDDKTISTYKQTLVSGSVTASNDLGVSSEYFTTPDLPKPDKATYSGIIRQDIPLQVNGDKVNATTDAFVKSITPTKNASYATYKKIIDSKKLREKTYTVDGNQVNAFGIYSAGGDDIVGGVVYNGLYPSSTEYPVYSDGNKIVKINIPWNRVDRAERVGSGLQDRINLTPLLDLAAGTQGDVLGGFDVNDLVKFRIQALNGDDPTKATYMIFRAYITQFTDNTDATWNEIKYAGRGDKFYIYDGFSRKINIGFKVAALSAEEMEPIYQKLNYLMGNVMPDYKDGFLMRGPLVKMTVGNWIDGQDGILNNVSYTIPQDSPWEIALNEPLADGSKELILPHIVEVSMTFTPIGSQTQGKNLISQKSQTTSHIAQNINDYQFIK